MQNSNFFLDHATCAESMRMSPVRLSDVNMEGLRLCQKDACSLLQNRDKTGSYNIGRQFTRLMRGLPPLRALSNVEEEMTLLQCGVCDS